MDFETYKELLADYLETGSVDRLLAEYGYPAEIRLSAEDFIKALKIIAAVSDCDINKLIELSGLNASKFAAKYVLPYRTLLDWIASGKCRRYDAVHVGYIMIAGLEAVEIAEKE